MKKNKTPAQPSKTITQKKSRYMVTLVLMFVIGALLFGSGALLLRNNNPTVLVWAADKNVKVPDGLVSYLERKHDKDCRDYKGTGSVSGVALFSVYETHQNRLAKMSYGCGDNLTRYIVAYKENGSWSLTRPTHYFIDVKPVSEDDTPLRLPECSFLSKHDFPSSFEPDCATDETTVLSR